MLMAEFQAMVTLIGGTIGAVIDSLDSVVFITSPHISLFQLLVGIAVFAEIWGSMMDLKDGRI